GGGQQEYQDPSQGVGIEECREYAIAGNTLEILGRHFLHLGIDVEKEVTARLLQAAELLFPAEGEDHQECAQQSQPEPPDSLHPDQREVAEIEAKDARGEMLQRGPGHFRINRLRASDEL